MANVGRDTFVDVSKGIGMLMIIRIHTEVFDTLSLPYPIIAVPLFFFLSGFYDNSDKPIRIWLPKSFARLVAVGITWCLIKFVYLSLLSYVKDGTVHYEFSLMNPVFVGVEWFLFALFYAKLATWAIHRSSAHKWLVLFALILMGGIISRMDLPFFIDEGMGALPFYYAGYVLYPYIKLYMNTLRWASLLGLVCMLLMPLSFFPFVLVPYRTFPIVVYPIYFSMTLLSFATIIWLGCVWRKQYWLSKFGTQTLGILVIHPLLLHTAAAILSRVLEVGSFLWIAFFVCVYFIVCVVSYYLAIYINRHFPLLMGMRR